jgi:hypothetical protein
VASDRLAPATSSRIDTTSWSGCAPTESVTPDLDSLEWLHRIGVADMATMLVMVAARRPANSGAEAGSRRRTRAIERTGTPRRTASRLSGNRSVRDRPQLGTSSNEIESERVWSA